MDTIHVIDLDDDSLLARRARRLTTEQRFEICLELVFRTNRDLYLAGLPLVSVNGYLDELMKKPDSFLKKQLLMTRA
jgi:hypothetical protein